MDTARTDVGELLNALRRSRFRSRFRLGSAEAKYLREKGVEVILEHGRAFIQTRLAPAEPAKDGRQTPVKGHPVFIAQHGTATCCRSCLWKWHRIPEGRPLTESEIDYILGVLGRWLISQPAGCDSPGQKHDPTLFA